MKFSFGSSAPLMYVSAALPSRRKVQARFVYS